MSDIDAEREALEDALFDLLDGAHDNARHIHAAECCWPFPGAIAALATFVAAREAASVEAALAPLRALADEIEDGRVQRPGMQRRRRWADRLRAVLPPAPTEPEVVLDGPSFGDYWRPAPTEGES